MSLLTAGGLGHIGLGAAHEGSEHEVFYGCSSGGTRCVPQLEDASMTAVLLSRLGKAHLCWIAVSFCIARAERFPVGWLLRNVEVFCGDLLSLLTYRTTTLSQFDNLHCPLVHLQLTFFHSLGA